MKVVVLFLTLTLLYSCKKKELDGELSTLQGKWKYIGSYSYTETLGSVGGGQVSVEYIDASEFENEYFIEFEQKGVMTFYIDSNKEKHYKLRNSFLGDNCGHFIGCKNASFKAYNKGEYKVSISYTDDSMLVAGAPTENMPLQPSQGAYFRTSFSHQFVCIN